VSVNEFYDLQDQYEPNVKWTAKMRPGDFYSVDENGEKWVVWRDEVVGKLREGKKVFQYVTEGKCREVTLKESAK
jgi:hypothetical protein